MTLQALVEKENGNAAYKKKEFDVALAHYDKAIELDPSNITFLTNKAGMCVCLFTPVPSNWILATLPFLTNKAGTYVCVFVYSCAIQLDPSNITFLTNKAGMCVCLFTPVPHGYG